jgi:hypothetical protein
MLLVVDVSGSMMDTVGGPGSPTRWDVVKDAVKSITDKYASNSIRFGLELFADPDQSGSCTANKIHVGIADNNALPIQNKMNAESPWSNTPIKAALDTANGYQGLRDATRANYVLLFTDGMETCDYDARAPVQSVKNLRANNIKTFVVGFGSGVDEALLGEMATEGGTARPVPPYYYAANTSAELSDAFEEIASIIAAIGGPCFVSGLQGVCADSQWSCQNGNVVCLQKNWPTAEACDGLDNNCDGPVDENLVQLCSADGGTGVQICSNGTWGECIANYDGAFPDAAPFDAGTPDTGTPDAGMPDAGYVDTGYVDAGYVDAGTVDAGPTDAGIHDTGLADAGPVDAGNLDVGPADAGPADAGRPDAGKPDSGVPDTGVFDAGYVDSGVADAGSADVQISDSGPTDAGIPDAGAPDAASADAAPTDVSEADEGVADAAFTDTAETADTAEGTDAENNDGAVSDRGSHTKPDSGSETNDRDVPEKDAGGAAGANDFTALGGGCSCAVVTTEHGEAK